MALTSSPLALTACGCCKSSQTQLQSSLIPRCHQLSLTGCGRRCSRSTAASPAQLSSDRDNDFRGRTRLPGLGCGQSFLKERTRRLVAKGHALMNGGYRDLLR